MAITASFLLLAAAVAGQGSYEVRLTEYRVTDASPAQIAAYESRDQDTLIASMRGHVRSSARALVRPGEPARVNAPRISGIVSLEPEGGDLLVTIDALPFYRGTPLRLAPCAERRVAASRTSVQGRVQISLRTIRAGNC